jgi:hypothetical protein
MLISWPTFFTVFLIILLCYYSNQLLADGVIPNEYGINPKQKLKIGSKVLSVN